LRLYPVDRYASADERQLQQRRIANAYTALSRLPTHPAIPAAHGFFLTEDEDRYVLVVDDTPGQALRLHIEKPALALTFDQKLGIARDLLHALAHAHAHEVVHRNISPSAVLYGADGRMRLINFDFARSGVNRTSTIAGAISGELEAPYQAPECYQDPSAASPASDIFSAGAVLYELFTGERPFGTASEVFEQSGLFAVRPSEHQPDLPPGFDAWLQGMCGFDPSQRPTAGVSLAQLDQLLVPPAAATPEPVRPTGSEPSRVHVTAQQSIDYENLPPRFELTRKYIVQQRLGKPGGFGVVYRVIDTLGDVRRGNCTMKSACSVPIWRCSI